MNLNDRAEKGLIGSMITPAQRCLELGSGFGRITRMLQNHFDEVMSIDFSNQNLRNAHSKIDNRVCSLIRADIHGLPIQDNYFDTVVMIRVAHHLEEPSIVFREILRVAKNHANVLISIPNPLLSNVWRNNRVAIVGTGKFGHSIYSTPFNVYSHPDLRLVKRRGSGIFENKFSKRLEWIPFLYLADMASARFWHLKKNVFLKFQVQKVVLKHQ